MRIAKDFGLAGRTRPLFLGALLAVTTLLLPASSVGAMGDHEAFKQVNLVSDTPGMATRTDPDLVNPWGLARSSTSPWWISDNGTGRSSIYDGNGQAVRPAVTIPSPSGGTGVPTGAVFNKVSTIEPHSFVIKEGAKMGPSSFMFATEDGAIAGWNGSVDANKAIVAVDRSTATDGHGDTGAVYKGLTFGFSDFRPYIYAADFRFGTVEMFDQNFQLVRSFTDPQLTGTCVAAGQCYAPFGIQNIHGKLYVTFVLQDAAKHDDQAGAGRGFVDVFNTNGTLERRLIAHGNLNSPWGLAMAPQDFGRFGHDLLVGNFGDGTINAYNPFSGAFDGTIKNQSGMPITIDGLWGMAFGNGGQAGQRNELFFTAGIDGEAHGLFGKIVENE